MAKPDVTLLAGTIPFVILNHKLASESPVIAMLQKYTNTTKTNATRLILSLKDAWLPWLSEAVWLLVNPADYDRLYPKKHPHFNVIMIIKSCDQYLLWSHFIDSIKNKSKRFARFLQLKEETKKMDNIFNKQKGKKHK